MKSSSINSFKNDLDKFWFNEEFKYGKTTVSERLRDGMPNGENDVLWAECRTSLGAMPNGPNVEN